MPHPSRLASSTRPSVRAASTPPALRDTAVPDRGRHEGRQWIRSASDFVRQWVGHGTGGALPLALRRAAMQHPAVTSCADRNRATVRNALYPYLEEALGRLSEEDSRYRHVAGSLRAFVNTGIDHALRDLQSSLGEGFERRSLTSDEVVAQSAELALEFIKQVMQAQSQMEIKNLLRSHT